MPPTMQALEDMLRMDYEAEMWRSYVAGALWRLDSAWGGKDMPRYEDLLENDSKPELTQEEILRRRRALIEKNNAGGGEES